MKVLRKPFCFINELREKKTTHTQTYTLSMNKPMQRGQNISFNSASVTLFNRTSVLRDIICILFSLKVSLLVKN